MTYEFAAARADFARGLANWPLWGRLGWQEVKRRYRRTTIGPFWTSISLAVMVATLGILWSTLWKQDLRTYMPFFGSGLTVWLLISAMITEGCVAFVSNEAVIKQLRFDFSVLSLALVWRNLIVFGHNIVVYIVLVALLQVPLTWASLLAVPGLALIAINGLWISTLMGMVCLRFRDVQQMVTSLLQVAMLATPIFWLPDSLGGSRLFLVHLNPLYHLIQVVRMPLLGQVPSGTSYLAVALITLVGSLVTFVAFSRFRRRIAYWA